MPKKKFMIDTNVFISEFKSGYTTSTRLLLKLLLDPEVELIVDEILLEEYKRWFELISKRIPQIRQQANVLYSLIKSKAKLEFPGDDDLDIVKSFFPRDRIC